MEGICWFLRSSLGWVLWIAAAAFAAGCARDPLRVALIPRTTASANWEAAHSGAQDASGGRGVQMYWNAPTSEDDVRQQAALIDRVVEARYGSLIVAPDQPLALTAAIQRAVQIGMRTVVIASPLTLSPRPNLAYVLNDDVADGRIAARRMGEILHGRGKLAVLGVNPESLSELTVLHSFEATLEREFPEVSIVDRRTGTHVQWEAQEIAEDVVRTHPDLNALFTLSSVTTFGAIAALQARGLNGRVRLVGSEQSPEVAEQIRTGLIDSVVAEDRYEMGYRAMQMLSDHPEKPMPAQDIRLQPTLLTRENIDKPEMRRLVRLEWGVRP